jgi:hypothetical protein
MSSGNGSGNSNSNTTDLVTTSFQMDYRLLVLLQKRSSELGFRSWGHYLRHVIDYHVLLTEPDLVGQSCAGPLSGRERLES